MLFKNCKIKYYEKDLENKNLYKVYDADVVLYDSERRLATLTFNINGAKLTKGMVPYWDTDVPPDEYWTFDDDVGGRFDAIRERLTPMPKEFPYLEKKLLAGFDAPEGGNLLLGGKTTASIHVPPGARVLILVDND